MNRVLWEFTLVSPSDASRDWRQLRTRVPGTKYFVPARSANSASFLLNPKPSILSNSENSNSDSNSEKGAARTLLALKTSFQNKLPDEVAEALGRIGWMKEIIELVCVGATEVRTLQVLKDFKEACEGS